MVKRRKVTYTDQNGKPTFLDPKKPKPILSPEEKWAELKRHLIANLEWYAEMQENPKADTFYFFLRSGVTRDILGYMMYLDGVRNKDNTILWALEGDPTKTKEGKQ